MTEEEIENEMNRNYKLGIIEGFRQSSNKVFDMAVEAFRAGIDGKEAQKIKKLSEMLLEMSKTRQEIHDKEYPKND